MQGATTQEADFTSWNWDGDNLPWPHITISCLSTRMFFCCFSIKVLCFRKWFHVERNVPFFHHQIQLMMVSVLVNNGSELSKSCYRRWLVTSVSLINQLNELVRQQCKQLNDLVNHQLKDTPSQSIMEPTQSHTSVYFISMGLLEENRKNMQTFLFLNHILAKKAVQSDSYRWA